MQEPVAEPSPLSNRWFHALQDLFSQEALIEYEEEGPVLYVWTWFICHVTLRHCPAPRIVRLDELCNLWLQDLYGPWRAELQLRAPTDIRVVHARPPTDSLRIDTVHIMIEQHPTEARAASVLSALFHGHHHDRLLQAAYSIPRWICTEDVIDVLMINHVCEGQRCNAFIGRIPMQQFIRHDVPSATSIELHVRPPECAGDAAAASSTEAFVPRSIMATSANSLMQVSTRWGRLTRRRVPDGEGDPVDHAADFQQQVSSPIVECEITAPGVPPAFALPWPTTWRSLDDAWTFFMGHHADQFPAGVRAEVWYSDHVRFPWSDSGRVVSLPFDFSQWVPIILQAWGDWFLSHHAYEIAVVTPSPIGGENVVHFHVMIVQQPSPDRLSCLITVMDRFADTWAPTNICLLLPRAVDHWLLLNVAVVDFQCPPADPGARCTTLFGNLELTAGNLFPVQQAMCFTITVDSNSPLPTILPGLDQAVPEQGDDIEAVSLLQHQLRLIPPQKPGICTQEPLEPHVSEDEMRASIHGQAERLCFAFSQFLANIADVQTVPPCASLRDKSPLLGETCGGQTVSATAGPTKVQISLAASLVPDGDPDVPVYDDSPSTLQWLHNDNWEHHCARLGNIDLLPLPEGLQVPLESYYAMTHPQFVPPCDDVQWEIYVDGATSLTAAAWSVVVVKVTTEGTHFHGQLSGLVEIDRTQPDWVGADSLDNIAAEFQAFLVALRLAHSAQLTGKVVVRPDLQLSRTIATFDCSTCSNPILANLIRLFAYWLGHQLAVVEVRGHQGQPWNELADRLAKFALQADPGKLDGGVLVSLHPFATAPFDVQWAWLQH